jgi:ATP-dependent Clp protease ATP-binding subunit ClpB
MFSPLNQGEIKQIVRLQFSNIIKMLKTEEIKLDIDDDAVDWLAHIGFDPQYGARPVKRIMQKWILNELSKQMLEGKIAKNQNIVIEKARDGLVFKNKDPDRN